MCPHKEYDRGCYNHMSVSNHCLLMDTAFVYTQDVTVIADTLDSCVDECVKFIHCTSVSYDKYCHIGMEETSPLVESPGTVSIQISCLRATERWERTDLTRVYKTNRTRRYTTPMMDTHVYTKSKIRTLDMSSTSMSTGMGTNEPLDCVHCRTDFAADSKGSKALLWVAAGILRALF